MHILLIRITLTVCGVVLLFHKGERATSSRNAVVLRFSDEYQTKWRFIRETSDILLNEF